MLRSLNKSTHFGAAMRRSQACKPCLKILIALSPLTTV